MTPLEPTLHNAVTCIMFRPLFFFSLTTLVVVVMGAGTSALSDARAQTADSGASVGTGLVYHADEQTLSAHLNNQPLNQVIEELSKQTRIHFRPPESDNTFDNRPVTVSFDRMPIDRAIKQLLGPSNTAMIYGTVRPGGHEAQPALVEVRVLDLGVIPVAATNDRQQAPSPLFRLTPEQFQARREEMQKRLEAMPPVRNYDRRGGQPNNASTPRNTP